MSWPKTISLEEADSKKTTKRLKLNSGNVSGNVIHFLSEFLHGLIFSSSFVVAILLRWHLCQYVWHVFYMANFAEFKKEK